jgi:hypothetical protein
MTPIGASKMAISGLTFPPYQLVEGEAQTDQAGQAQTDDGECE